MDNNSLKEYYIKLHTLYNNAVNMLTAINQSLTSNASEVSVEIFENTNKSSSVRIPSFLYLDNKLEQLETSFNNLFNMPNSGEAWFSNDGNMYKLEMVRSNTAPITPDIDTSKIVTSFSNNQFIKDLVNPRTFLKMNINNLPFNIKQMFMKKIVLLNTSLYGELNKLGVSSYDEYISALYNYKKGVDYEEYDTVLDLPIKRDKYNSEFNIEYVLDTRTVYDENNLSRQEYTVRLNTLEYTNAEDLSETYTLKVGDTLCLGNELAIYKVVNVDYTLMTATISEKIGHVAIQPVSENNSMVLRLYTYDYSEFNYLEVPVEENQYIILFIGSIYNGVRSQLSSALLLDMSSIYMVNEDGSYIKDNYGNNINYIEYYNKYCNNIGDLILGLIQTSYPQISNYNAYQLKQLQDSDDIVQHVSNTINTEGLLSVVPINSHIYEDGTVEIIKNYHAQKTSLQASLNTLTENINTTNNTLLTTDWAKETEITQNSLHAQLQEYYAERLTLEKQLSAVVAEISTLSSNTNAASSTKYRIRGVTNIKEFEIYIKSITNSKVSIIGIDIEYKYKSVSKTTTSVLNIDNNVFTDWNKQTNIDRQRKLFFDETSNGYTVDFVNYDSVTNIIKWNQIDIPINPNEDVIIRIRYKYNIGQPFINIYSPWSEELTVSFPIEYSENVELAQILNNNSDDTLTSKFTNKLINDGYEEHITNKLIASNNTFFHMPENIYSGFNTSENNLISLKDKLLQMCSDIDMYKDLVQTEVQKKFKVFLQYDGKNVELQSGITNKINIYNTEHISDYFARKEMNIVIKNTGTVPVNLYSILPGNVDVPLVICNYEHYQKPKVAYQRLPIFVNNKVTPQTLGQWVYFRQYNVYTNESVICRNKTNDATEYNNLLKNLGSINRLNVTNYIGKNNIQLGLVNCEEVDKYYKHVQYTFGHTLGFIDGKSSTIYAPENLILDFETKGVIQNKVAANINADSIAKQNSQNEESTQLTLDVNKYIYAHNEIGETEDLNTAIYMYEDICAKTQNQNSELSKFIYLDKTTSITEFIKNFDILNKSLGEIKDASLFNGAFLFVNLEGRAQILTEGKEKDSYEIPVGETVSIPIVFEYFLYTQQSVSKMLMFDLKHSLVSSPMNFILELTANYDNSNEAFINNSTNADDIIDDANKED